MVPLDMLLAFLGGVCPALLWLFFWLMEDRCEPEPKRYIFYSFLLGMVAVGPALYFEWLSQSYFMGVGLLLSWAVIEEVVKFGAAYFAALRLAVYDEPLDAVIYLVTAALGFSALENALFLWSPIVDGNLTRSLLTEDLRFMGATLLHTLSAATVGLALAWSFSKPAGTRKLFALLGLILAVTLHTIFNFFILTVGNTETLWVFACIWFGIIAALLLVERIKQPKDYC
jgi:RsiW-degrading membrane proteinase PrsW (M82 family)